MQKIFWLYILLILLGFVFLSLPEDEKRVIVINDYHGPSVMDIYGIASILASWICMLITAIVRYRKIKNNLSKSWQIAYITGIMLGTAWIIISLSQNADKGWLPGELLQLQVIWVYFLRYLESKYSSLVHKCSKYVSLFSGERYCL